LRAARQVLPGTGADLTDVEQNLRTVLKDSGLFEEVKDEHTDDPDQLVIGLCRFRPYYTEADGASRLEELWADRVRYPLWRRKRSRPTRARSSSRQRPGAVRAGTS